MSFRQVFACRYCGRDNFKSQGGLNQHVTRNQQCAAIAAASNPASVAGNRGLNPQDLVYQPNDLRQLGTGFQLQFQPSQDLREDLMELEAAVDANPPVPGRDDESVGSGDVCLPGIVLNDQDPFHFDPEDDDGCMDAALSDSDDSVSVIDCGLHNPFLHGVTKITIQQLFNQYCGNAKQNFIQSFDKNEQLAVTMLDGLRRKRATLDTYDTVLEIFYRHQGLISPTGSLGDAHGYISRKKMMHKLAVRYGIYPQERIQEELDNKARGLRKVKMPSYYLEKPLVVPSSKAKVDVIKFDFRQELVALLTDPRFSDKDFLHHDNDPLAPPPASFDVVGDINTGLSYRETYQKLVVETGKVGKAMLLPIPGYIDATATGQFVDLKVESFKFTVGILNRKVSRGVLDGVHTELQSHQLCLLPDLRQGTRNTPGKR